MNEGTTGSNKGQVIDTTDCLEAVGVFRGWKNFFFLIVLICLLGVQISFWLVDAKLVPIPAERLNPPAELSLAFNPASPPVADANNALASKAAGPETLGSPMLAWLTFDLLTRIIELVNGILIITAVLYCMAMFFSLMVSLIGRLGGINHISRAFFLSLIMAVLVMPWQKAMGMNVPGVIYTPAELITWLSTKNDGTANIVLYYLRFAGYWLVVALLLLMSQLRSARWSNAILRRLEII